MDKWKLWTSENYGQVKTMDKWKT